MGYMQRGGDKNIILLNISQASPSRPSEKGDCEGECFGMVSGLSQGPQEFVFRINGELLTVIEFFFFFTFFIVSKIWLRPQVKHTQLAPINRVSPYSKDA